METSPAIKDVVVTLVGAATGVVGLVLVFLGLQITALQSYPGDTAARVLKRYRTPGWFTLGAFVLGLSTVTLGTLWLVAGGGDALYRACLGCFLALIGSLGGIALSATLATLL